MLTEGTVQEQADMAEEVSTHKPVANSVLISLSSFGAAEVRRHGQLWFAHLAFEAGADGVEVRSELLLDAASELPAISQAARQAGKNLVYSCADYLWTPEGGIDHQALDQAIKAAKLLGAPRLKMAIGSFSQQSHTSLTALQARLHQAKVELVIENDQTAEAGSLAAMLAFFDAANSQGIFFGLTFDMGNWHWVGECPLQAAAALSAQVTYVHCKGVQRQPPRWVAVPVAESSAAWRAVLRALPATAPWAIEYPLVGDDLLAVTRREIEQLRRVAASMATHQTL